MQSKPCQHRPQQPTVGPQHSLPDPKPKLTILEVAQKKGWPEVVPFPFLNIDPVAHIVGHSNEAPVIVNRQEMTALIDLGVQVSSMSSQFCEDLALQIQPLGQLLELEGTRVQPSHTLGSWRSTSRSWGSENIMRIYYCWSHQPWPTQRLSQLWLVLK